MVVYMLVAPFIAAWERIKVLVENGTGNDIYVEIQASYSIDLFSVENNKLYELYDAIVQWAEERDGQCAGSIEYMLINLGSLAPNENDVRLLDSHIKVWAESLGGKASTVLTLTTERELV